MSPQYWKSIKTEILPNLKCHQNQNVTKTEMPWKLKYHLKLNITKTKKVTEPEIKLTLK